MSPSLHPRWDVAHGLVCVSDAAHRTTRLNSRRRYGNWSRHSLRWQRAKLGPDRHREAGLDAFDEHRPWGRARTCRIECENRHTPSSSHGRSRRELLGGSSLISPQMRTALGPAALTPAVNRPRTPLGGTSPAGTNLSQHMGDSLYVPALPLGRGPRPTRRGLDSRTGYWRRFQGRYFPAHTD